MILLELHGSGTHQLFINSLIVVLIITFLSLVIWTVKDVFSNKSLTEVTKLLWTIIIISTPFLGILGYWLLGRTKRY